jgi:hypothetical protein
MKVTILYSGGIDQDLDKALKADPRQVTGCRV